MDKIACENPFGALSRKVYDLRNELQKKLNSSLLFVALRYKLRACNMSSATCLSVLSSAFYCKSEAEIASCNSTVRFKNEHFHLYVQIC